MMDVERCMGRHEWALPKEGDTGIRCLECPREIKFGDFEPYVRHSIEAAQLRHGGENGQEWVEAFKAARRAHQHIPVARSRINPLIRIGAHMVLASREKVPIEWGWLDVPACPFSAWKHAQAGGLVGIVPGASGLVILDVDEGTGVSVLTDKHPPLAVVKTPRGRHLLYERGPLGHYPNQKWTAYGLSGDLRCDSGYAVCWEPAKIEEALKVMEADPGAHPVPDELL